MQSSRQHPKGGVANHTLSHVRTSCSHSTSRLAAELKSRSVSLRRMPPPTVLPLPPLQPAHILSQKAPAPQELRDRSGSVLPLHGWFPSAEASRLLLLWPEAAASPQQQPMQLCHEVQLQLYDVTAIELASPGYDLSIVSHPRAVD